MDESVPSGDVDVDPRPREGADQVSALLDDWLASVDDDGGDDPSAAAPAIDPPDAAPLPDAPADAGPSLLDALAVAEAAVPTIDSATAAIGHVAARGRRFVLFAAGPTTYAVPGASVIEVGRVPKITPVPRVPAWLRGVTNLRGDVTSVIDLRTLLGLDPTSLHTGRLLVVRLVDEEFSLGLLVDAVDQIASLPVDEIKAPASPLEGALATYLTGVCHAGDRLVAMLDLDRLLRSEEIRQFDDRRDGDAHAG